MNIFREQYGHRGLSIGAILSDLRLFLAFGFGSGLVRKAPGTLGTLAAVPLYYLLVQGPFALYLSVTLLACVLGIHICDYAAKQLGEHDYGGIVWDEVAGYLLTMAFVPSTASNALLGFVLFRAFDIIKPPPIAWIDARVDGGLGIMLDDIVAGLMAGISCWLIMV